MIKYDWKTCVEIFEIPVENFLKPYGFSNKDIRNHGKEMAEQIINAANFETLPNKIREGIFP